MWSSQTTPVPKQIHVVVLVSDGRGHVCEVHMLDLRAPAQIIVLSTCRIPEPQSAASLNPEARSLRSWLPVPGRHSCRHQCLDANFPFVSCCGEDLPHDELCIHVRRAKALGHGPSSIWFLCTKISSQRSRMRSDAPKPNCWKLTSDLGRQSKTLGAESTQR